jgi:inosose dehydratase
LSTILVGSAPDSWGVWFPDDPQQTPDTRFLDEVAASGYHWIELGPYGYLPTDPKRLSDELAARDLKLSAGTVFEHLHQDDSWDAVWTQIEDVARLTAAVGGKHVVVIPEMWREPATGEVLEDRNLTAQQWKKKTEGMNELGRAMFEKYGVRAQYHPHADSHVDTEENVYRFLDGSDREFVNLCLDTSATAVATTSRSSNGPPTGSATCTSSRSIPRYGPRSRPRICRSVWRSSWAR